MPTPPAHSPNARPLVIGHRGASGRLPENTLLAFRGAFEDGADGLELDVRLSRDGVPVVVHDATLRRTTGLPLRVSEHTAAELAEAPALSVGRRGRPVGRRRTLTRPVPRQDVGEVGVATLDAVLAMSEPWNGYLYVELKGRVLGYGDLEAAVARALAMRGCHARVTVLSFNHAALRRIRALDDRIRTAATFAPGLRALAPDVVVDAVERAGSSEAALHVALATRRRVEALHERGFAVSAWTVNSPTVGAYLARAGVAALMTDFPARFAGLGRACT